MLTLQSLIIRTRPPSSSHPALPRPTPTSISYLSSHPALFVDKPRGHWPAHMVPMWHFSNSLMARLEAPLYVCNWRLLLRRGLATVAFLFFLTLTPTQTPPLPPPPCSVSPGLYYLIIPSVTPRTQPPPCFRCTLSQVVIVLFAIMPPHTHAHTPQPHPHMYNWHCTLWKRAASAGSIYHELIWSFILTHSAHAHMMKQKKSFTKHVLQRQQMMYGAAAGWGGQLPHSQPLHLNKRS